MKLEERSTPRVLGIRKGIFRRTTAILVIAIGFILIIGSTACQSSEEATASPAGQTQVSGNETSASDPEDTPADVEQPEVDPSDPKVILASWEGSAHADTFVLDEEGNNNTCARCHAPVVWLPSMDDVPESCLVCKFELSEPPPLIPESEWVAIECNICHKVDKKGNVEPEFAWLEIAQIEEYAEVESSTELCQKCHTEIDLSGHAVPQLGGAHADYACTDCHDAHDTLASCSAAGCHEDVLEPATPIPGHDADHELVTCVACHDAGEMEVDLDEELGLWTTFVLDPDGEKARLVSHNTVLPAPCERCHYPDNPWDLSAEVP